MIRFVGRKGGDRAKQAAIKQLEFRPFEATFGASEAPGHGASVYDGLEVDFEIDPTKKSRSGPTQVAPGRPGAELGRPGSQNPRIPTCQTAKIRKFEYAKMPKCQNAKVPKCQNAIMLTC